MTAEDLIIIKKPILLVGIGGPGIKIVNAASAALDCKCLFISNDKKDFPQAETRNSIFIDSGEWINPSRHKLRAFVEQHRKQISSMIEGFATIIIVSNLAGRSGTAIAPLLCKTAQKSSLVISVAIMPFRFEKDRIFSSGIALRRLRETSHSTIVMDNDAFLDNNPELSKDECFTITNSAIVEIISSISKCSIRSETNILCTSKQNSNSESCLRDSVAMLYDNVQDARTVRRAMLYVMGGDRIPLADLNNLVSTLQGIFKEEGTTEITMSSLSPIASAGSVRVHLVASAPQATRFDRYDPLREIIPDVLDWDEPDSSPDIQLAIQSIE
jgi:cell division protein FtsZ